MKFDINQILHFLLKYQQNPKNKKLFLEVASILGKVTTRSLTNPPKAADHQSPVSTEKSGVKILYPGNIFNLSSLIDDLHISHNALGMEANIRVRVGRR